MRQLLFTAALCLCVLYVQCVPIQKESPAAPPAAVLEEGKKQEETQGVFIKPTAEPLLAEVKESAPSAPVETKVEAKPETLKETGRQGTEDDDDDDDDDDLDLGVDDGDDDDDDEEDSPAASDDDDDDDDDDYFDSFFDDILGEDDDDDDDEEDDVAPVAQPADSVPEVPVQETEYEPAAEEGTGETDNPIGEEQSDSLVDKDPTDVAASSVNTQQQVIVQPVPDDDAEEDDDDDDDDDEDEIEGDLDDLTGGGDDDDDDDDDATDDDDDDDDEDDLEDVIEARSRSLQITKPNQTRMPSIYISKYNRFVDNILGRINRILGKSYDPVRVKLQSDETKTKKKTPTKPQTSSKKKKNTKKRVTRITNKMGNLDVSRATHKMGDVEIARSTESESREPAFVLIAKTGDTKSITPIRNITLEVRANPATTKKTNKTKTKAKPTKTGGNKTKTPKQVSKARATLFGLSTLRREGDVVVNMMSDYTTVKTNFLLGPLTLRVEKEFGRGSKREVKSATATTAEMFGKLNLRIVHGGAATLHSIKVLQPKQVRVDSADNHEKTKQYLWRRSSHIASVVSAKLASAARSMLKPPPNDN